MTRESRMEGVVIADNAELESKARRLKTQTGALSIAHPGFGEHLGRGAQSNLSDGYARD